MMAAPEYEVLVAYLGEGQGGELWGGTLVNFAVDREHWAAREVGVLLTHAAADYLAEKLGREKTHEFEVEAARAAGEAWLRDHVGSGEDIRQAVTISVGTFEREPHLVDAIRQALGAS